MAAAKRMLSITEITQAMGTMASESVTLGLERLRIICFEKGMPIATLRTMPTVVVNQKSMDAVRQIIHFQAAVGMS